MIKKVEPQFSIGGLFICSKCGQGFNSPDQAEKLKTELRTDLKNIEAHKKIRIMTSGCLGVCEKDHQTFAYCPNEGSSEIYITDKKISTAKNEILDFVQNKI